jgi:predicted dehydrogenase
MMIDFSSGTTGLISSPRPSPVFWRVHVFGKNGNIEARGPLQTIQSMAGQTPIINDFATRNALQYQLEAFARAVEQGCSYLISPTEILQTVAAFEACASAVYTGRKIHVEQLA